jgi:hypothetical protein
MIGALLLTLTMSFADEAPSLFERAQVEASTPIVAPEKPAAVEPSPSQLALKLEDNYRDPNVKTAVLSLGVSLETFRLSGTSPNESLGSYDLADAGSIPFVTGRISLRKNFGAFWSLGAHLFGGYGMREYDLGTPTRQTVSPKINALAFGLGASARLALTEKTFSDFSFEIGAFSLRQSSSESSFAQWSEDAKTELWSFSLGRSFSAWELAAGFEQRRLTQSRFRLLSDNWILSTGVHW